ncbi:response regulator transcription factor [Anaeromicropila herbilytica]|uniref:Stage 0 sporulation protein A homolog n=1 Tax=Anaeromicropila herbilytica TaxID=2785025 RepID=A0A7R7EK27_9FIRM|nr:response regulator transcription factor [Anaeromicropila herbilytica]BCN30204.1 DNA-binding response regulator [Anaeromicropila herbilytica]
MRLLIIEDNKDLCDSMCFHLQNEGYTTDSCYTGEHALYYALQQSYDVIILDRMLPVMDGLSILKSIRNKNINVPVIMVTAMDGLHDRIDGLDSGADDYLVKPFAIEELLARIRALARRPQKIEQTELLTFSNLILDVKGQSILADDKSCSLSKRETDLLEYFMRCSNQIISREIILSHVWGPDNFVEEGNLDNYIHFLRRRLKTVNGNVQIKTIHRVGYRLEELQGEA